MKKIFFYSITLIFYYLFITAIVFSFSYISLINGKTYDWFWVKSIQKKTYFRGTINIWQYNNNCTTFDKNLFYKPKVGKCNFSNPEFETVLNFDEFIRTHDLLNKNYNSDEYILVLGDSIAMGWGVNNDKTFSYLLEKSLEKKVYNLGVSSYGTVREIKRMLLSPYYKNSKTILIQYHPNDLYENQEMDINKIYLEKNYIETFENDDDMFSEKNTNIKHILRNYKTAIRLFFADIIDILFKEDNLEIIDFKDHQKYLEEVIKKNIEVNQKNIIVFLPIAPYQKVKNFPNSNDQIKYYLFELENDDFFNVDDHPNQKGHLTIANKLNDILLGKE